MVEEAIANKYEISMNIAKAVPLVMVATDDRQELPLASVEISPELIKVPHVRPWPSGSAAHAVLLAI